MAIEGPLRELGIHDLFQLLDLSRKTGVLRVTSELRHNAGTISFEGGAIVFAEIRSNPHPLGALQLRTGKISEADLERARDMQERQGDRRRLGQILVSLGALTPRELERQLRFQIEEVVFEVMSWREGYFSFSEGPPTELPTDATVRIPTEALLMEGARGGRARAPRSRRGARRGRAGGGRAAPRPGRPSAARAHCARLRTRRRCGRGTAPRAPARSAGRRRAPRARLRARRDRPVRRSGRAMGPVGTARRALGDGAGAARRGAPRQGGGPDPRGDGDPWLTRSRPCPPGSRRTGKVSSSCGSASCCVKRGTSTRPTASP